MLIDMNTGVKDLLSTYPRQRQPLPERDRAVYEAAYVRNRAGVSGFPVVTALLESWMHRKIANSDSGDRILEIGAGNLNHLKYERNVRLYDVVEPSHFFFEGSESCKLVTTFYDSIFEIPFDKRYDRIISVAVLEHLTELPRIIARSGILLGTEGRFEAGIPTEGGLMWNLGMRWTTALEFRLRTGLDYLALMRHEHVNTAKEILAIVNYFFDDVQWWGFPFSKNHLSFYTVLRARRPNLDRCRVFGS